MNLIRKAKNLLLAGLGATALTVEKTSEVIDDLAKKGEITVEQGKAIENEIKHKIKKSKDRSISEMFEELSPEELEKIKQVLNDRQ